MTAEICAWCAEPAVTHVITRPGRAHRQTAPVCETHARSFEARDILTVRVEIQNMAHKPPKRSEWVRRT
jgi:hypothetical protein